jgi:hypothetical protein
MLLEPEVRSVSITPHVGDRAAVGSGPQDGPPVPEAERVAALLASAEDRDAAWRARAVPARARAARELLGADSLPGAAARAPL